MKLKKLKSILACVLVLCMLFGVQSNLAFAQENDDTIVRENVADYTTDMTDDTDTTDDTTGATTDHAKNTDTTGKDDVNSGAESEPVKLNYSIAPVNLDNGSDTEIAPQSDDNQTFEETDTKGTQQNPWDVSATGNGNVTAYLEQNNQDINNPTYTLSISGSGVMKDFSTAGVAPWHLSLSEKKYETQITKIEIGKDITVIGDNAFVWCKAVQEVAFEEGCSLTEIKLNGFHSLEKLTNITFPASLKVIGEAAFHGCKKLETVTFKNPNNLTTLGGSCFGACTELKKFNYSGTDTDGAFNINIPQNVTTIGSKAFQQCRAMTSVVIPAGVETLTGTFYECSSLEKVAFEEGSKLKSLNNVSNIGVFYATAVTSIDLPDSLEVIGDYCFFNCKFTSIEIPATVISIGIGAFRSPSIEKVIFAKGSQLKEIRRNAFDNCSKLQSIVLPEGLTTIGQEAFKQTSALSYISIPSTVTTIERGAFYLTCPVAVNLSALPDQTSVSGCIYSGAHGYVIYLSDESMIGTEETKVNAHTGQPVYAVTNGGSFALDTVFEKGKLAVPSKSGSIFKGWYTKDGTNNDWGDKVTIPTTGETYYAKWIELKTDDVSMEYGSTKALPTIADVTLSNWESGDRTIVSIEGKKLKANKVGKTTITATATDDHGSAGTLTVNIEVTPMRIIYGSPDETEDGRPYIVYSLNEDGTAPKISDILGFYPVKEKQGESGYEADTSKPKITLNPGMGADGDVEYTYVNDVSNNKITTDTLPTHPTVDENGNPHSIRVEMKLKNPNYRFTTVGTDWKPKDTIILYVTCYEKGMVEIDMYLEGDENPLDTFDERQEYEYTGEGIVPTTRDLTTLYTKGETTTNTITQFTAHFHAVEEGTAFSGTHLTKVKNTELTTDALKAIAPKELGVYSFVVNGYNNYTKTYCYVSRRYRIIKGSPKGCPTFNFIESGKTLSDVQLSGTMKNKIGKTVTGTFTWENGTQTVQAGTAYKWTFTPDDNDHYEVVNGESIVCPIHQVIFDTNGGSKVNETNAEYNKEISEPETTREGYRFVGWYMNKECTKVFDFKTPITQDITLYAKWNGIPTIKANDVVLTIGDKFDAKANVTATDKEDGDITKSIEVISNNVDTSKAGTYKVIYKATDSQGASVTKAITVTIKEKETQKPAMDTDKKPTGTDTDKKPANADKLTASDNPETGDTANITAWLALMIVSLGLLAGSFAVRKSRKS